MRQLVHRVPKLHRLAVLDAVARAGDFTSAARDLDISQPAVSRHMAALARELGVQLFARSGRSFVLTEQAQTLASAIDAAFISLERTLEQFDTPSPSFVFAVQPAMATTWVVPLLDQLEIAADTEIRLRIFERIEGLEAGDWDLAIVPGKGHWDGWGSMLLFQEAVRPFASPSLAAKLALSVTSAPAELAAQNLLHIDAAGRPNMTWDEWFAEASDGEVTAPPPRLLYNAYPTVIQEALAGNGVALGWQHLLSDMDTRGLLVPVGPTVRRQAGGHYACWRAGSDDDRHRAIIERLQTAIPRSSPSFVDDRGSVCPATADLPLGTTHPVLPELRGAARTDGS